jgi:periplasmic protein TonB
MTSQQILKADLLDILFENRNKEYGAYVLRRDYPSHLKKAIVFMLLPVFVLFLYSMSKPPRMSEGQIHHNDTTEIILEDIDDKKLQQQKQIQEQRVVEKAPPTRKNPTYKIIDDDKVTKDLPVANDTSDIAPGPVDSPGNGGEGYVAGEEGKKPVITTHVEPTPPAKQTILDQSEVSSKPEFPGGDEAWLAYLQKMLRAPNDLESGERKTVKVKFVVNTDGEVTDAVIVQSGGNSFDKEVLRVINRMPKWKPGKQKGTPVAVYFTQPVTFVGEEE